MVTSVRAWWSRSRTYRVCLTAALIFGILRLVIQALYLGMLLFPGLGILGGTPDWVGNDRGMVPPDLQIYLDAAQHFRDRERLYLQGSLDRLEEHYPYGPAFAVAFAPFLLFSPEAVTVIHTALHILAYVLLYATWDRLFRDLQLTRPRELLALTVPLWLVFSAFWGDLSYLNIYLVMALIGSYLIEAVLHERLGLAVLCLTVIAQIKPHWAFAAIIPLLLGRYRFFFKLVGLTLVAYAGVAGVLAMVAGPAYIGELYADYLRFLSRLSRDFPWRGPDMAYLGYNHSIRQIVFYRIGVTPRAAVIATGTKLLILAPLAWVGVQCLRQPLNQRGDAVPQVALDMAFAAYLGAFVWLDMVWEVALGIVIFPYLLATTRQSSVRAVMWAVFVPYALVDVWQVLSLAILGMDVIEPGPYVRTDYSIYAPVHMIVIVVFYAVLIRRLWPAPRMVREEAALV